jgi:hypothetical protein
MAHPQSTYTSNPACDTDTDHVPTKYYGLPLNLNTAPSGQQPVYGRAPIELNKYIGYNDCVSVSSILFDAGSGVNVDLQDVQCQAYSDADGTVPLGAPFTLAESLSVPVSAEGYHNGLAPLGGVLCYVSGGM